MAPQPTTEQEMFPLVESWLKSRLTQKQFCATHQMPAHILAYWVGRYRKPQSVKTTADKGVATSVKASKKIMVPDNTQGFIRLSHQIQHPHLLCL
jgi:hypothetical protein